MALQLPEPDYYTIEEVAQRWGVSADYLLRLGGEGKIDLGVRINNPFYPLGVLIIKGSGARLATRDELVNAGELWAREKWPGPVPDRLIIHPSGVPKSGPPSNRFCPNYMAPWLGRSLPDGWVYVPYNEERVKAVFAQSKNIGESAMELVATNNMYSLRFPDSPTLLYVRDIIVPIEEIHRIENRHDEAQKAAAEDVLGTKERETVHAIIAAMAEVLAEKGGLSCYRGESVNATAIARKIAPMISDRKEDTIRRIIADALKAGLIQRP